VLPVQGEVRCGGGAYCVLPADLRDLQAVRAAIQQTGLDFRCAVLRCITGTEAIDAVACFACEGSHPVASWAGYMVCGTKGSGERHGRVSEVGLSKRHCCQ